MLVCMYSGGPFMNMDQTGLNPDESKLLQPFWGATKSKNKMVISLLNFYPQHIYKRSDFWCQKTM